MPCGRSFFNKKHKCCWVCSLVGVTFIKKDILDSAINKMLESCEYYFIIIELCNMFCILNVMISIFEKYVYSNCICSFYNFNIKFVDIFIRCGVLNIHCILYAHISFIVITFIVICVYYIYLFFYLFISISN